MNPESLLLISVARKAGGGEGRRLRLAAGLTLAEVAAAVGCALSQIHRWETGQTRPGPEHALNYGRTLAALMAAAEIDGDS